MACDVCVHALVSSCTRVLCMCVCVLNELMSY